MANHKDLRALKKMKNIVYDPILTVVRQEFQKVEYYLDGQYYSKNENMVALYEITKENKDYQCMIVFKSLGSVDIPMKGNSKYKNVIGKDFVREFDLSFVGYADGDFAHMITGKKYSSNAVVSFFDGDIAINIVNLEDIKNFAIRLRSISRFLKEANDAIGDEFEEMMDNPHKYIDESMKNFDKEFEPTDESIDVSTKVCLFTYHKDIISFTIRASEEDGGIKEGECKLWLVSHDKEKPEFYFIFESDISDNYNIVVGTDNSINAGDYVFRNFKGRVRRLMNIIDFSRMLLEVSEQILSVVYNIEAGIAKPISYEEEC